MLAQAVRGACGVLDGEPLEVRRRKLRARAGRHLDAQDHARVSEFLGEACGAPFPDEESVQLRAARRDPVLMGDQVQRAFEDFVEAETAAGPLVLVLEDLHWSDHAGVALVDRLLRNLAHRPLFVLGAGRPETTTVFPRLWAQRAVTQVTLGRLLGRAARALVTATLGDAATDDRVQRIVDRADGNAFFLEELIRAAAEGRWDDLPDTVVAVAEARLAALEPEARRLLRAASVFGVRFPAAALPTLLGEPAADHDTEAWLSALCERELLVPAGPGGAAAPLAEVDFRHAFLREAAYAMLTEEDRRLGHRLAGAWLEGRGGADAHAVAEHFELGQDRAAAGRWWGRAASDALRANDLGGAVAHAERAIDCGAEGESLGTLRALQADANLWRGDNAAGEQGAREALALLPAGSALWFRAAMRLGTVMARLSRGADLETLAASLRPVAARDDAARLTRATGLSVIASNLFILGRSAAAEALLADVAPAAEALAALEPGVGATLWTAWGSRALLSADLEGYARAQERAVELQGRAGNLRGEAVARSSLGHAWLELGLNAAADAELRTAEAICERMGLLAVAASAQHNRGLALFRLGRLDEARAVELAAVEALAAQGSRRLVGGARMYLATILLAAGEPERAEEEARGAAEVLADVATLRPYALGVLAQVLLASGRTAEALDVCGEAMSAITAGVAVEAGEPLVRLVHAEALRAAGQRAAAQEALAAAAAHLHARAARLGDPDTRRAFLEQIPEHARTLALARGGDDAPEEALSPRSRDR
jgi:hypothetical protein